MTPNQKASAKKLLRKSYLSFSKAFVKLHVSKVVRALANIIRHKFRKICSTQHNSLLMSENFKNVFLESTTDGLNYSNMC